MFSYSSTLKLHSTSYLRHEYWRERQSRTKAQREKMVAFSFFLSTKSYCDRSYPGLGLGGAILPHLPALTISSTLLLHVRCSADMDTFTKMHNDRTMCEGNYPHRSRSLIRVHIRRPQRTHAQPETTSAS